MSGMAFSTIDGRNATNIKCSLVMTHPLKSIEACALLWDFLLCSLLLYQS